MKKMLISLVLATTALLPVAHATDLKTMPWQAVVAQAKKEGRLVWSQWYFRDGFRPFVKSFEQAYGIKITIPEGTHDSNISQFLAQSRRRHGDVDVLSLGGSDVSKINVQQTLFGPLSQILPNANKRRYEIESVDSHGYGVAFWGNQTGIAYNPAMIKPSQLPQTVADFSDYLAKHPGSLGFNTIKGGSGPAFFESVARRLVPDIKYETDQPTPAIMAKLKPVWDWFRQRKDQYVITASNADSVTRLNGGEFAMVASWEDLLARLQKKGEVSNKLKFYIPKMGMPGGGNMVVIPKNARHPAAALVFIHWLTSAKVQSELNRQFGSAPQNSGASSEYALIPAKERQNSTNWPDKTMGDALKKTFIDQVTLN
jgi:putative spermidine/putrescine transport system substrate-binding protein